MNHTRSFYHVTWKGAFNPFYLSSISSNCDFLTRYFSTLELFIHTLLDLTKSYYSRLIILALFAWANAWLCKRNCCQNIYLYILIFCLWWSKLLWTDTVSAFLKWVLQHYGIVFITDEHLKESKDITTFKKRLKTCFQRVLLLWYYSLIWYLFCFMYYLNVTYSCFFQRW